MASPDTAQPQNWTERPLPGGGDGPRAGRILLAMAAYFIAGRLALLLAIPPGYASPVWPAAGIALALSLRWGWQIWPGVALGSFLLNFSLGLGDTDLTHFWQALPVPASIGLGAALQMGLGWWLWQRWLSGNPRLDRLTHITRFAVLIPAVSCLVGASVGTTSLVLTDMLAIDNAAFNWATWWVGDAIGVLLFTPLVLCLLDAEDPLWRARRTTLVLPLIAVFAGMVYLFVLASAWESGRRLQVFARSAENLGWQMQRTIDAHLGILQSLKAFFDASTEVTEPEFRTYVEHRFRPDSGLRALEWVPRVAHAERAIFEQAARLAGHGNFVITQRQNGRLVPATERPLYFPVRYIVPLASNEAALGFDLYSNPSRREALQRAESQRLISATETLRLVQEQGNQPAVLAIMSVFPAAAEAGPEARGHVLAVFRIDELLQAALHDNDIEGLAFSLHEVDADGRPRPILHSSEIWPGSLAGKGLHDFHRSLDLAFGDRIWRAEVSAGPAFLAASRSLLPWGLLAGGLLFCGLLGAFLLFISGETARARATAERLRAALRELHATQDQLVESERLASLGSMMSALAHELNGPIGIARTAVSTGADRLREAGQALQQASLTQHQLESALHTADEAARIADGNLQRASRLIQSYRDITVDRATGDVRRIGLRHYLEEVLDYQKPAYRRSGHVVELDCPADLSLVTRPGSLSQVVINLINNSLMHAFDEGQAGRMWLRAHAQDDGIRLCYQDNGRGIPDADSERVFEAYYTTRKGQGGTGLGLHLVREIITAQLGGRISLQHPAEGGVRFEIVLPYALTPDEIENTGSGGSAAADGGTT